MIVAGVCAVAWVVVVWQWQDPFTAVYTKYQQHKLAARLSHTFADYRPPAAPAPKPGVHTSTEATAERARSRLRPRRTGRTLQQGEPVGRLIVPRLGLKSIVVNGTSHDDLTKGPGRELHTYMPGQSELIYVAGHRTTYLAPFAHIDSLRPGDRITFELPYGTFHYEVTGHRSSPPTTSPSCARTTRRCSSLQACHPRFFATHRYLAYAKLVRVEPRRGATYTVGAAGPIA